MTPDDVTNTRFSVRLRAVRQARGLTARQLADKAGLSEHVVQRLEAAARGASKRQATLAEAVALAETLQVPLAVMLADEMNIVIRATP